MRYCALHGPTATLHFTEPCIPSRPVIIARLANAKHTNGRTPTRPMSLAVLTGASRVSVMETTRPCMSQNLLRPR
jgi:hypothetical protein